MNEADRYRPDFPWGMFPAAVERLRAYYADGLSYSQCAAKIQAEFGGVVTRSSVSGKVYRAGLTNSRPKPKPKVERRAPLSTRKLAPLPEPDDITDLPPDQSEFACTIGDLGSDTERTRCRWPLGDPSADMQYCGAPCTGSWCGRHSRIVWRRNA